jgi:hypothetical protein
MYINTQFIDNQHEWREKIERYREGDNKYRKARVYGYSIYSMSIDITYMESESDG